MTIKSLFSDVKIVRYELRRPWREVYNIYVINVIKHVERIALYDVFSRGPYQYNILIACNVLVQCANPSSPVSGPSSVRRATRRRPSSSRYATRWRYRTWRPTGKRCPNGTTITPTFIRTRWSSAAGTRPSCVTWTGHRSRCCTSGMRACWGCSTWSRTTPDRRNCRMTKCRPSVWSN